VSAKQDRLRIVWAIDGDPEPGAGGELATLPAIRKEISNGRIFFRIGRYRDVELLTPRLAVAPQPFKVCLVSRLFSRRRPVVRDLATGRRHPVTWSWLGRLCFEYLGDHLYRSRFLRELETELARLENPSREASVWRLEDRPVYFRTDFALGLKSGGSVGHIAGVLNHLGEFTGRPCFLTTDRIPTVREDVETHLIPIEPRFREFSELPLLYSNHTCLRTAEARVGARPVSFVYQRSGMHNFAGLEYARRRRVPFVLEFNGSEVWIALNWGNGLVYPALAERIELLNLRAADVVVVVSKAIQQTLVDRGIDPGKVLVNPNGVEPQRYSPTVSGDAVRHHHSLDGKVVVGFIGTFGAWHGAEVLADAFGRMLAARPDLRDRARLLMIGDGVRMPQVKANLDRHGVSGRAVLTGLVPQEQGPEHLAACDLLASPHVPNSDGTPFFGSPTKLFEYMAMGKGIVASDLEQIGEVLEHDRTAWMVRPGDPDDLARGLAALIDDPTRRDRLGAAARAEVVAKYTWREHTRKIIARLQERCG
jgi:glycosyltransferase involved in cell wall biosynthesis